MNDASRWQDELALVTGASGDIGSAIVDALLARGARVAAGDLVEPGGGRPPTAERFRFDSLDVADDTAVRAWVDQVVTSWGTPTIAIAAAGVAGTGRLVDTTADAWHRVLAATLDGAFYTARAAIAAMLAASVRGRVVFVGSWAASAPHTHIGAYSVAKAGLRQLSRVLALDHAQDGILVNEVAPGIVRAGLSEQLFRSDPGLLRRTLAAIPSGAPLVPGDVARDVLFLASPENTGTTGATLVTDGALSLASTMNTGRDRG